MLLFTNNAQFYLTQYLFCSKYLYFTHTSLGQHFLLAYGGLYERPNGALMMLEVRT